MTPANARRLVVLVRACRGAARILRAAIVPGGGFAALLAFAVFFSAAIFLLDRVDFPRCALEPASTDCDADGTFALSGVWRWPLVGYGALRLGDIGWSALASLSGLIARWWRGVEQAAAIADAEDAMVHDVSARAARAALSAPDPLQPGAARLTIVKSEDVR